MFTYCNNNPANYIDPTGRCKNTFSIYLKVDCGEEDCPHSKYYIKNETIRKVCQVVEAVMINLDAEVAIGLGFYGEFNVLEVVGVAIGQRYDLITLGYRQGKLYSVQTYFEGMEVTFWYLDKFDFMQKVALETIPFMAQLSLGKKILIMALIHSLVREHT